MNNGCAEDGTEIENDSLASRMDEATVSEQSPLEAYLNGNLNKSGPVLGRLDGPRRTMDLMDRWLIIPLLDTDESPQFNDDNDMLSTKSRNSSRNSIASSSSPASKRHSSTPSFAPTGVPSVAPRLKRRLSNALKINIPSSSASAVIYRTYSVRYG